MALVRTSDETIYYRNDPAEKVRMAFADCGGGDSRGDVPMK